MLGNLYNKKMKKVPWVLVFLILINMIPQITILGLDTNSNIPMGNVSGEIISLQAEVEDQDVAAFVYSIKDSGAKVTDIWVKGEWSFTLYGVNFTENIKEIHLTQISNSDKTITIAKEDTEVINEKELKVTIKGENAKYFSTESSTGSYKIEIEYEDGSKLNLEDNEYQPRDITVTGQNFRQDIKQVILRTNIGAREIILPKEKVQYINNTTLKLSFSSAELEKLSGGLNNSDVEMTIDYQTNCIFSESLRSWEVSVFGDNFTKGIQKVILRPIAGQALSIPIEEQDIIIERKNLSVANDTRLNLRFEENILTKLKEFNHSGDYKIIIIYSAGTGLRDYTTGMDLKVLYNYGLQFKESITLIENLKFDNKDYIEDSLKFTLLSKSTPKVIEMFPKSIGGYPWFNENDLSHNLLKDRSFLKVTFEDIDGKLEFNAPLGINYLISSTVQAIGSNSDYLDREFLNTCRDNEELINQYLFKQDRANKTAHLFIPIKPLSPQTDYLVNIAEKVLRNDVLDEGKRYSEAISWEFTTMAVPSISDNGVNIQTVVEDYDYNIPIKIFGDFFYSNTIEVFFNDEKADSVTFKQDKAGNAYLEVFLPRRRRLKPGIYNIIIKNDNEHTTTTYGTLSILHKGEHIPTEEYKIKNEDIKGDILSDIKVSSDTLYLRNSYRDNRKVELDLDELMGEEVWTRRINYRGARGDNIGELTTKSKYGDISLFDLALDRGGEGNEINLYLGRVEPLAIEGAKNKLKGKVVKSNFIEIRGENCTWDEIHISIPYKHSSGDDLEIYRYDEIRRTWNRENSYVDKVNQRVNAVTDKVGIFVIIER